MLQRFGHGSDIIDGEGVVPPAFAFPQHRRQPVLRERRGIGEGGEQDVGAVLQHDEAVCGAVRGAVGALLNGKAERAVVLDRRIHVGDEYDEMIGVQGHESLRQDWSVWSGCMTGGW